MLMFASQLFEIISKTHAAATLRQKLAADISQLSVSMEMLYWSSFVEISS
jgi:hypothetical protein